MEANLNKQNETRTPEIELLKEAEMAKILRLHPSTLQRWRREGRGPRFLKLGDSKKARIRYIKELP